MRPIMKKVGAAKFKEQCLALLEKLTPEGMIITKHGRPVARVTPYPTKPENLIGLLRDRIEIHGDLLSTGIPWDADAQS
jgi:antitoxin (DNA-binding transcriptional repressor) of toxin-antitoxin stability system